MPAWNEWQDEQNLLGVMEDAYVVQMSVRDLPENPIAYDAVDTIVWDNVDPADLKRGNDYKFRALQDFVRRGGHLVICQSPQWQQYSEFGELLPVDLKGIDSKKDLQPLHGLSGWSGSKYPQDPNSRTNQTIELKDPWDQVKGPFTLARAQANPGTIVDEWIDWDDKGTDRTPFIVRKPYGLGAVTWVAQDLGDTSITSFVKQGWASVWNRVFDWKDTPIVVDKYTGQNEKDRFARGGTVDIGRPFADPSILNLTGTVSSLVALAVAFFIIYWVVAGPGIFAYLVNRRRQNLSWFGFTLSAMIATLVTVLIVRLVVRGPPELKHNSVVEEATGQPELVRSSFGLYIKQDGDQRIELMNAACGAVTTLSPLPINPDFVKSPEDSTSAIDYQVPVRDISTDDPPALTIYYRNTAKKFEANWVGQPSGRIEGTPKAVEQKYLDGNLTNGTGQLLQDVYIAFKYPGGPDSIDWVYWMKEWQPGVSIDLAREFYENEKKERPPFPSRDHGIRPNAGPSRIIGRLINDWQTELWEPMLKGKASVSGEGEVSDVYDSFVLASLFDRMAPIRNMMDTQDRVEVLRRGARHLDRSTAIAAGSLVIICHVPEKSPMPVPLEVEGEKITGDGNVFYQFVLPVDRSALEAAATTQQTKD
jgi:hypothetical protein